MREQTEMARGIRELPYTIQYADTPAYLYPIWQMVLYTMGWPVFVIGCFGLLSAIIRGVKERNFQLLALASWVLILFGTTAGFQVKYPRYLLPLYPSFFILGAIWFWNLCFGEPKAVAETTAYGTVQPSNRVRLSLPVLPLWVKAVIVAGLAIILLLVSLKGLLTVIGTAARTPVEEVVVDPSELPLFEGEEMRSAFIGGGGRCRGCFHEPMGIARRTNGELFVVEMRGHRVQRFNEKGELLNIWGGYGDEEGHFREPRSIDVDSKGFVYVADSWNHRVQVFTPEGNYQRSLSPPGGFYGPRGVTVAQDKVYVTDAGHSTVQVFRTSGEFVTSFGKNGQGDGEFHEPVGLAVEEGKLFVVDSVNGRIQRWTTDGQFQGAFPVPGWEKRELREAYLSGDGEGRILLADPSANRIVVFSDKGEVLRIFPVEGGPTDLRVTPEGEALVILRAGARILRLPPGVLR